MRVKGVPRGGDETSRAVSRRFGLHSAARFVVALRLPPMPHFNWTVAFRGALGIFFVVSAYWLTPDKFYTSLVFAFIAFALAAHAAYGRARA
jgi:hypothetical protein